MRASGILLPISSIPSPHGIGCFDRNAYRFVDTLVSCGQKYWQILPMGPTGYGDSPYQSFSTFAGNPYYISLDALAEEGLLTAEEIAKFLIKSIFLHAPLPVVAKGRWRVDTRRARQTEVILRRNDTKFRHTSLRQRDQLPCQLFAADKPASIRQIQIAKCHIAVLF